MKGLQGKVALVTGGSSGIGQAIAIRLGADGASVAINYVGRSEGAVSTKEAIEHGVEMCMKQVAEAGGRPILVGADVSDEQAVEQMFDRVMSEYGRLDILVNNAGIQIAEDSHELSAADFDKVLAVNLRGAFLCARQAVRAFLAAMRPGVIVNVSSVHQVIPKPRFLGYSVSKGGMQNLTRSLALEYAARGIRSTASAQGPLSRRSTGPGSTTRSSAEWWRATSRCDGPAAPRRWPRPRRSCAPTRPPTSPARRCLSTAASPCTPPSRPPGPPSYLT